MFEKVLNTLGITPLDLIFDEATILGHSGTSKIVIRLKMSVLQLLSGSFTFVKDTHNLQHSSFQSESISLAIYVYSYKVYKFEKENKFPF